MRYPIFLILIISALISPLEAGVRWKDGRWISTEELPCFVADEHYRIGCEEYNCGKWKEAARHFRIIACNYADTKYGPDSAFFLAISEYNLEEYEDANRALNCYLRHRVNADHFFEAIEFKFCIAEIFKNGARRRLFSYNSLPKMLCGLSYSLEIYDEIVFALPNHEMAAQALFSKAEVLVKLGDYREAIDTYQILLRRFPKHEYASLCYINILRTYLRMAYIETQNPDILSFAQLNYNKFARLYPRDEFLPEAETLVMAVKECYAYGFYELGCYYERSGWDRAAAIYYNTCSEQFPDTQVAQYCLKRLEVVGCLLPAAPAKEAVMDVKEMDLGVPCDIDFDE